MRCIARRRPRHDPARIPSRSTAWIRTTRAPRSGRRTARGSTAGGRPSAPRAAATAAARSASAGPQIAADDPLDRGQRQAFPLQGADLAGPNSACSGPYQATRPSRTGAGSNPSVSGSTERCRRKRRTRRRVAPPCTSRPTTLRVFARTVHAPTSGYDARRGACRSPRQPRAHLGLHVRHDDPGQRAEGAVRNRVMGRRAPVPTVVLLRYRAAAQHGAARREPTAVHPAVLGGREGNRTSTRCSRCTSCGCRRGSASSTTAGFFTANAILLWLCAAAIATYPYMLGGKALWFALAPTLLIYGFMNWDLFAVAFATGAPRRLRPPSRRARRVCCFGLGAAAKFYPVLLALPLDRANDCTTASPTPTD